MMQTCSPAAKYNYNSNSNLLSLTSSKVRAATWKLSWNRWLNDMVANVDF